MYKYVGVHGRDREMGQRYGKTLIWLINRSNNLNGFGGLGWSRSVDMLYENEGGRVLRAALLTVGAGVVESTKGKAKLPGS